MSAETLRGRRTGADLPPPGRGSRPGGGPRGRGDRVLLVALLLVAIVLVLAASRGWQAYRAYQRLRAAPVAGTANASAPVRVPDWVPLRAIARRHQVPQSVLVDALREAGFSVGTRNAPSSLAESVRRRLGVRGPVGGTRGVHGRRHMVRGCPAGRSGAQRHGLAPAEAPRAGILRLAGRTPSRRARRASPGWPRGRATRYVEWPASRRAYRQDHRGA